MIFSHLSRHRQKATAIVFFYFPIIFLSFSFNTFHNCFTVPLHTLFISLLNHFTLWESIAKPLHTKGSVCNVTDICYNITKRYNLTIASNKVEKATIIFLGGGADQLSRKSNNSLSIIGFNVGISYSIVSQRLVGAIV